MHCRYCMHAERVHGELTCGFTGAAVPPEDDPEHYACPTALPVTDRAQRDAVCRVVLLADARGRLSELLQYYPGRAGDMLLYLAQEWVAEKLEACGSGEPHEATLVPSTP